MALISATIWPVINVVETGKTPEYPNVIPMYYSTSPTRVLDEIQASFKALDKFDMVDADIENKVVKGTRKTRLFRFVDDIEVKVEANTEFVAKVTIKSSSRVGKGDFGQNARNINTFFTELNNRLGAVRIEPKEEEKEEPKKDP